MARTTLSAFLAAAVAGFFAAVVSACGPQVIHCTRANCGGCCTADDRCVLGNDLAACGTSGGQCKQCDASQQCLFGTCTATSQDGGTGGSVGGGAGGGSGGSAGGDPGTGGGATGGGTGGGSTGGSTGGGTGGGVDVNAEIAAVRAAADRDAGSVSLPIDGVLVSYLKPLVVDAGASDPAGFFVQFSTTGPALFVQADPSTVIGGPLAVGDTVSFTVTSVTRSGSLRIASGIDALSKSSSGSPVRSLVQNASSTNLGQSANIDELESELVSFTGQIVGSTVSAGSGYKGAAITSLGTLALADGGSPAQLRLPLDLAAIEDLTPGCAVTVGPTPLWRFNARAQISAWDPTEVTRVSCPAPKLLSAKATTSTAVLASFDRNLDGTTIAASAFAVAGPGPSALTVTGATLTAPRQVTLTTATQSAVSYTLTVDATVTDSRGQGVDSTAISATFTGIAGVVPDAGQPVVDAGTPPVDAGSPVVDAGTPPVDAGTPGVDGGVCGAPQVVISQVYTAGGNVGATWTTSYVELHNRGAASADVTGWTLQYHSATGIGAWYTTPALTGAKAVIPPGGFLLVAIRAAGTNGAPLSPTADLSAPFTISISPANAIIALVPSATLLTALCPSTGFADLVGTGTASCFLGGTAAPALSATLGAFRKNTAAPNLACVSTSSNSADFVTATPAPRSSASAASQCTCP